MKHAVLRRSIPVLLMLAPFARAGTPVIEAVAAPPADSGWWWTVAPYAWVPATTGDVGVAYQYAPVDVSISDTLSNLDIAFMLAFEAGKGNWTFGFDGVWGRFSVSGAAPTRLFTFSRVELEQFFARAHVGYTLVNDGRNRVEVFGGVRYSYLATDLTLVGVGGGLFPFGKSHGWFDPVVGVMASTRIGDRSLVRFAGDIGGFGVESDLIWQANIALGYEFTERTTGFIGYRAIGVDYSDGGFLADIVSHGPFLGLAIEF